ncbi:hypothetical protein IWQ47_000498 [Aquimarina sp. EL_43]|uniref:hypothetical protein n=1 Tax=Aquimarina TaxID=290174 RepID=UPI0004B3D136|nr:MULTISPECIES: hypothetical protein [Aquimarina]MBG6128810.1 hypothetical protein [Aquimarina sp. EL_35]MBG6149873.1 hypothetical protein [Aquimarina sp. EL_32]MBG6167440.1 hypothetical protein [Aquimarina sp. EL_43]
MKRPQSISVIFTTVILAALLMSFKAKPVQQNQTLKFEEIVIEQVAGTELIGEWVMKDDPETFIIFKSDKTVVEKSKTKTTENTWSVNAKDREVCISNSGCIYYEVTETSLFLYIDKKRVWYNKYQEK